MQTLMFFDSKDQSVRVYNDNGLFYVGFEIRNGTEVMGRITKKFFTVEEALAYSNILLEEPNLNHDDHKHGNHPACQEYACGHGDLE